MADTRFAQRDFSINPDIGEFGDRANSTLCNTFSLRCEEADGISPGRLVRSLNGGAEYAANGTQIAGVVERILNQANDSDGNLIYPEGKRVTVADMGEFYLESVDNMAVGANVFVVTSAGTGAALTGNFLGKIGASVNAGGATSSASNVSSLKIEVMEAASAGDPVRCRIGFPAAG